jgi:hypothetical protein
MPRSDDTRDPLAAVGGSVAMRTRCAWREDEDGQWRTACAHQFEFHSEPPHDWCKYCCYCGAVVAFTYYDEMAELRKLDDEATP